MFLRKKITFLKIKKKSLLRVLHPFVKVFQKYQNLNKKKSKNSFKWVASQKMDFFLWGERKYGLKDWTNFGSKNPFYIVVSKQTKLFV